MSSVQPKASIPSGRVRLVALAAVLCAAAFGAPAAAAAPATYSATSANGETAFFVTSEQLATGDTDSRIDVYLRTYDSSLERYVTREVSTGPTGGNDAFTALFDGASVDGTRAFFSTDESLVSTDTDHSADVYMRDLVENSTSLVSRGDSGCAAGGCGNGEIDADFVPAGMIPSGTRLFFVSEEQLASSDTDAAADIYMRDIGAGFTDLVSRGDSSCAGEGCGSGPSPVEFRGASADGTKAIVVTDERLASGDGDGLLDIYQRNLTTGVTSLVSATATGTCPAGEDCGAVYGGATGAGSHVYFETNERLSPQDEDSSQDVYDWSAGSATLVSTGPAGGGGAPDATFSAASADGSEVYFATSESLVVTDTDTSQDVYERAGGVTSLVSTGPAGGNGPSPATLRWVSPDGSSSSVLFNTEESLTTADTDSSQDVYARDAGVTTLVSTGPQGGNGAFNAAFGGASNDGSHVFLLTAEALVSQDTDSSLDIYEVADEETVLVSTGPLGGKGAAPAGLPTGGVAQDGSHAFFVTEERLTVDDLDAETDIYDRSDSGTLLVSVGNSTPLGPPTPSQLSTDPTSPGESTTPRIRGQADPNTSIKIYTTPDCSGAPVATGTSLELGGAGITVTVATGSTTSFRATATDANNDTSPCSAPVSYTQQNASPPPPPPPDPGGEPDPGTGSGGSGTGGGSTGSKGGSKSGGGAVHVTPRTRITFAPAAKTRARRPVFRFTDSTGQAGTAFRCKVDRGRWRGCGSPVKVKRLNTGRHVFQVQAINAVGEMEPAPVKRRFKVVGG